MGFFGQERWSGFSPSPPGDFPDLELAPPVSLELQADSHPLSHQGSPNYTSEKEQTEKKKTQERGQTFGFQKKVWRAGELDEGGQNYKLPAV